ncbi:AAA family ATPase [Mesonia aestuariivivens]|uniref:ATP-binding protein n=1 Tax=Mesonia aestuariivivens TaxID=2796128 RepID=A0ABS6W4K0_9FLAO|nr:ATP-binding protein [Mesonia aestuariivivens]MBW2962796.1 ATP-binding protein [Mesonia aestuariivivens]
MHNHSKIVILGGPGTGKSSVITELKNRGYPCFDEVSREIIQKAQKEGIDQLFLTEPLLFSEKLLEGRINQFKQAQKIEKAVFIDRGIPDVTAYMDFKKEKYPLKFSKANIDYTYDQAFLLPVWPEIYKSDTERYENLEEAFLIEKELIKTYKNLGYHLIEVPKTNVKERTNFILENLKS